MMGYIYRTLCWQKNYISVRKGLCYAMGCTEIVCPADLKPAVAINQAKDGAIVRCGRKWDGHSCDWAGRFDKLGMHLAYGCGPTLMKTQYDENAALRKENERLRSFYVEVAGLARRFHVKFAQTPAKKRSRSPLRRESANMN